MYCSFRLFSLCQFLAIAFLLKLAPSHHQLGSSCVIQFPQLVLADVWWGWGTLMNQLSATLNLMSHPRSWSATYSLSAKSGISVFFGRLTSQSHTVFWGEEPTGNSNLSSNLTDPANWNCPHGRFILVFDYLRNKSEIPPDHGEMVMESGRHLKVTSAVFVANRMAGFSRVPSH